MYYHYCLSLLPKEGNIVLGPHSPQQLVLPFVAKVYFFLNCGVIYKQRKGLF